LSGSGPPARAPRAPSPLLPYALLTLAALFFGGNFPVVRAVGADLPPLALSFWRWVLAAAALAPFALPEVIRAWPEIRRNAGRLAVLGIVGIAGFTAPAYTGLVDTTAINGSLINATSPIFMLAFAALGFDERLGRRQAIGLVISLAGVVAIVTRGEPARLVALEFNRGDLWVMVAVFLWSIYMILVRRWPMALGAAASLFVQAVVALPVLLGLYLAEIGAGRVIVWSPPTLAALAYIGLFSSVLSYLFWNIGVARIGAGRASLFQYLIPVFAAIIAIALVDERLYAYHAVGAALIVGGLVVANARR
jgi:drug/metabolite transporter (DMT)-like permease